ncbi:cytochrome c biogenesis protein DipZ [soil metagenome]
MILLLTSFLAGVLTSLAPCVLPLLPVIVGSSLAPGAQSDEERRKPYVIAASLAVSVVLFTLILKVSTSLIGVDPSVWLIISGGIVLLLGLSMLFPTLWATIALKLGFESQSNTLLEKVGRGSGLTSQIATGAALGPVFSSCSPVYALVLATVLPVNLAAGIAYIISYALGLALALLVISLMGRKLTKKLGWTANPNGWFRRILAILLIVVGIAVMTGLDKKFQTWAVEHLPFDITKVEKRLIPSDDTDGEAVKSAATFNVDKPYAAPEFQGIASWINSSGESMEKLKGKAVLIDFWTYSCINCKRTQPYLNAWYDKYQSIGLQIVGVHAPEFAFEQVATNVKNAVEEAKIKYPVGLDNSFSTWKAYSNRYWPAKYLVDATGKVRYTHFGEGDYQETEKAIQTLLAEAGASASTSLEKEATLSTSSKQTPETYLGYERGERFANASDFKADAIVTYHFSETLSPQSWALDGSWEVSKEESTSKADGAKLRYQYSARDVYLVITGAAGSTITSTVNGRASTGSDVIGGKVTLSTPRLYHLVAHEKFLENQLLELTFPAGVSVHALTFGG